MTEQKRNMSLYGVHKDMYVLIVLDQTRPSPPPPQFHMFPFSAEVYGLWTDEIKLDYYFFDLATT